MTDSNGMGEKSITADQLNAAVRAATAKIASILRAEFDEKERNLRAELDLKEKK